MLMKPKKKKQKTSQPVSIPDLVNLAEEQLQRGRIDEAIDKLRRAEAELKKFQVSSSGKKVTIPPHIVVAQSKLPHLLARALLAHSLTLHDPKDGLAAVAEAAKLVPDDARYPLASGAFRLLSGNVAAAYSDFQSARERWPEDQSAARALALVTSAIRGELDFAECRAGETSLPAGLGRWASGDLEAAAGILGDFPALDHNPSRLEAASLATRLFYSGALKFVENDLNAAGADFKEALRLAQAHRLNLPWSERIAAYYRRIAERVFEKDLPYAIECWQGALLLDPADKLSAQNLSLAMQSLAIREWRAGRIEAAYTSLQEALKANPQDEQLLRKIAVACEKLGRKSEAVVHWRTLARTWRKQSKDHREDSAFTDRLLKLEQHLLRLMMEAGSSGEEVFAELDSALKFDPDNHELRLQLAEIQMELGKPRQSLKHLEIIEKQQGISVDLLVRKAEAFNMLERSNDARKTFERALELDPSSPVARRSYLIFLGQEASQASKEGEDDEAMAICERQLSIDPGYAPALTHLAFLKLMEGEVEEGKELVDRLLSGDPQSPQKHAMAGGIFIDAGLKSDAERCFKKAIEIEPSEECYISIGMSYWDAEYKKEGLKYLNKAAEKAGIEMLIEIAVTLVESGGYKEADPFLKKAIKLDPSHPIPHMIRGLILMGLPFMRIPSEKDVKDAAHEFGEAERLMIGRDEYRDVLPELRNMKRLADQGPPPILSTLGGLGGLPIEFLDEMLEDEYIDTAVKPKKKRKRR
jgi:tetratricopeptide (TPR) repeat protein